MGAILTIQLSAFSNKKVLPNAENIAVLMPKLKELSGIEFLPNVVNSQTIYNKTGTIENVSDLSFSTMDNSGQVICTENRIDCVFNFDIDHQEGIEDKFNIASEIIQFIMKKAKVFANRLALNVTCLSNICNGNSVFEKQVMYVGPFYKNKTIKEWSSRTNARGMMSINGIEESLNIITEYTYATEQTTKETRIICHTDINTIPENKDFRFESDSIAIFKKQARSIFLEIQDDLEGLIQDEK